MPTQIPIQRPQNGRCTLFLSFLFLVVFSAPLSPHPPTSPTLQQQLQQEQRLLQRCGKLCTGRLDRIPKQQLDALLRWSQKHLDFHQRLRLLSKRLLGAPYRYGPLGEGPTGRYDRDPIYRRDRFDCVTYLETVMAYAMAHTEAQSIPILQQIRYKDGKIDFAHRNHFTFPQWLVENRKRGLIFPATESLGHPYLQNYHQAVPPSLWDGTRWKQRIPFSMLPKSYTVRYVPLEDIPKIVHKLPWFGWMGEVFDLPHHASTIAHVGFFVRESPNHLYFRHANAGPRGIRQDLLLPYAKARLRNRPKHPHPKRILGFIFATFPRHPPSLR